jgi:hypothetical protein
MGRLPKKIRITFKTKMLIYELKEKYPQLPAHSIADLLHLSVNQVDKMFNEGEIIIPSKINSL